MLAALAAPIVIKVAIGLGGLLVGHIVGFIRGRKAASSPTKK